MELKKANYSSSIPLNNEWMKIDSNYLVHPRGYVRSLKKGKLLKAGRGGNGYLTVALGGKSNYIHRLVALTFIENPENKICVNHKDGNKLNNHISNLEWVTHGENNSHAIKNNLKTPINKARGVIQMDMNGNEIKRHRTTEIDGFYSGCICLVANGKRNSHAGYKWKFIN